MNILSKIASSLNRKGESGQTLVLVPVILIVSLAMSGGVIDLGNAYLTHARLQSALDAGALAAAQDIGNGQTQATATQDANTMVHTNGFPNITFDPTNSSGNNKMTIDMTTDTVRLDSTLQLPTYFMKLFGLTYIPIKAHSTATLGTSPAFQYALFSNQKLNLALNNISVDGSVHSNGSMDLNTNNGYVTGRVEVYGTYSASGNDISYGSFANPGPYIPMPQYDMTQFEQQAEQQGTVYTNGLTLNQSNVTFNSIIYVNGNVNITANNLYCTMIVATGSITINVNNLTQTNNQGVAAIFSGGDITIDDNNSKSLDGFIYAPNGTIDIQGNTLQAMLGEIIGQNITMNQNNIGITYDSSVLGFVSGTGKPRLIN